VDNKPYCDLQIDHSCRSLVKRFMHDNCTNEFVLTKRPSVEFAKPTHRPKLEDRHWYNFKALLKWPDNLGRWVGLGHGHVWATTLAFLFNLRN